MSRTKQLLTTGIAWLLGGGLLWWLLMPLFIPRELQGDAAIEQVRYATAAPLAETQQAVSQAHFLSMPQGSDGVAYYQFKATPLYIKNFLLRASLNRLANRDPACMALARQNLQRDWWNPQDYPSLQCFRGRYDGATYHVLYEITNQIVFLKVQGS
jgi:hypothetical protein